MLLTTFLLSLHWWAYLFVIGLIFFPLARRIFPRFLDFGYPFAKIIGTVILSYIVFVLGVTHIAPFTQMTIFISFFVCALIITVSLFRFPLTQAFSRGSLVVIFLEEILFLLGIFFWAYIRSFQPDIIGLEKYMDFGFVNSILRSTYFPPRDMWYTPLPINYYYFGHLVTAVLTKLSAIPSNISFNLMLATLFSFSYTLTFSLVGNIWFFAKEHSTRRSVLAGIISFICTGIIGGFLVTLAGNLHTLYAFFAQYAIDNPVPFWQLIFSPKTFPNSYWYPNATRFIYHTIHEFPSYSFVVSDLHGHVLDIPMVLTTLSVLFTLITKFQIPNPKQIANSKLQIANKFILKIDALNLFENWKLPFGLELRVERDIGYWILLGFSLAVMYMTNAWDGMIYFFLTAVVLFIKNKQRGIPLFSTTIYQLLIIFIFYLLFSLPFSLFFNPGALVGGIGFICSPQFLINIGKIGPFVFEPNHCMHSPLWQLGILYGFFVFWFISFLCIFLRSKIQKSNTDVFVFICAALAFFLIVIPEFFYLRDIYTTYFRANTMFKLVYQAFILFSVTTTYSMFRFFRLLVNVEFPWWRKILVFPYAFIGIFSFAIVAIYPYFSINSYYGNLSTMKGLNGTAYLLKNYPTDALGITWLNQHVSGQPVILEAQGDSYTEYARVSANTGLPTVIGWPVHEWLWRGTYDIVAPRIADVQTMYETTNPQTFLTLARKYHVGYVFVGQLERTKYPKLNEQKFRTTAKIIFEAGTTIIYSVSS